MEKHYIEYKNPVRWIVLMAILGIYIAGARAQQPYIQWQTCNLLSYDQLRYSVCSYEGGYFVGRGGDYRSNFFWTYWAGLKDIVISRFDSIGGLLWNKSFGGSSNETVVKMRELDKDRCLVLGTTDSQDGDIHSGNKGKDDIWVFVIDTAGQLLWEKTYGGPEKDEAVDVYVLEDKSFIVAANITAGGGDIKQAYGGYDIWLFRCDSMGNMLWQKTLGAEGTNMVSGFIVNDKGNLVLTGTNCNDHFSGCYNPPNQNIIILEYDMQSDKILWNRCYGSWSQDNGGVVIQYGDGYVFAASVSGDGEYVEGYHKIEGNDIWLVKTDWQGFIEWKKCLGGSKNDYPVALFSDAADYIYLFGNTWSADYDVQRLIGHYGATNSEIWMLKLNGDGEILYNRAIGGSLDDFITGQGAVYRRKDERGYVVAAGSISSMNGDVSCNLAYWYKNLWLFEIARCDKYEPGTPRRPLGDSIVYIPWRPVSEYKIDPPENAWTFQWKVEPEGAAEIRNMGLRAQLRWKAEHSGLVKVYARACNICGCGDWSAPLVVMAGGGSGTETAGRGMQIEVGPNPTRGRVKFRMPVGGSFRITITDIGGAVMAYAETQQAEWEWDGSQHRAGMYLYRIESSVGVLNGKLVVVK